MASNGVTARAAYVSRRTVCRVVRGAGAHADFVTWRR
jgi:hypothetical protein